MTTISRRTWLFGVGSLTFGLLAAARQVSPLSTAAQVLATPTPSGTGAAQAGSGAPVAADANALRIPPLLSPAPGPDGMRTFDLTLQRGRSAAR